MAPGGGRERKAGISVWMAVVALKPGAWPLLTHPGCRIHKAHGSSRNVNSAECLPRQIAGGEECWLVKEGNTRIILMLSFKNALHSHPGVLAGWRRHTSRNCGSLT